MGKWWKICILSYSWIRRIHLCP